MEWDYDMLAAYFNKRDQKSILAIPLSWRAPRDSLMWAFANDGLYNVKTDYMLGKGCNFDAFHIAWVEIWKMDVSPNVRHFFWRLCTNTLPTRLLLKTRHLLDVADCPWCGEEESCAHAIFECQRVLDLWDEGGCAALVSGLNGGMCSLVEQWKKADVKLKQRAAFLAWIIWSERNAKVFEDKLTPNVVLLARLNRMVSEFGKYNSSIYKSAPLRQPTSRKKWSPPCPGTIKVNTDASLATEGWVGLGVVARDHAGEVVFAATRRVRAWWPPQIC